MFGSLTWGGVRYSRHHLTMGLARQHRVVLVDQPEELRALLRRPWRLLRKAGAQEEMPGIARYHPPGWLPEVYRWPGLRATLNRRRARSLMDALGPEAARAICYAWEPGPRPAVEAFGELPLVYHCYDKYDRYTNAPALAVRQDEEYLARRAAVCFAASAKLGEHLQELGARRVVVLRHGVDANVFRPGLVPPAALTAIPAPRIGVVARMNEALDIPVLMRIAHERPEWSLILAGVNAYSDPAKRARFADLCARPNVYYVGPQPPQEIPNWLCGMQVALVSYDLVTWAPYNQPIKTYEYLACGLPVVSSDITASRELGNLVERCGSEDTWVPAIERALAAQPADLIRQRLAFARENSWERRVAEVDAELARLD